ncbi:hypothetical protein RIF23_11565 [Lipingzhangella sp. LS1_29]|uniref:Uncharacterized protein n=1 Tax=Lipingzhangella rawalii TaxID=2055835 RepID=A0ABU2H6M6_9ACTN|nr:hypothetical protein [Lipingzhangella rawalii]MDS1270936.1 hypothetical protein [Lipingzhangella rawalii]
MEPLAVVAMAALPLATSCTSDAAPGPEQENTSAEHEEDNHDDSTTVEFDDLRFADHPDLQEFNFTDEEDVDYGLVTPEWAEKYEAQELRAEDPTPEQVRVILKDTEPPLNSFLGLQMGLEMADPDGFEHDIEDQLEFPGAVGGAVMRSNYTNHPQENVTRQWDIILQTEESPMYHIRYGGAEDEFNEDYANELLDSLEVNR